MSNAGFVVLGQSNATAYGSTQWPAAGANAFALDVTTGKVGPCADPLPNQTPPPNADAAGGSIWSRLGWLYAQVQPPPWQAVCFALAAVNGSSSASWMPGAVNYPRIALAKQQLIAAGFPLSAYLWVQGEYDAVYGANGAYKANILAIVNAMRATGDQTPFLVAICTCCRQDVSGSFGVNAGPDLAGLTRAERLARFQTAEQIQYAQYALGYENTSLGIWPGANMDQISPSARWDGCHLNDEGQWRAAELWLDVLTRYQASGVIL